MNKKLLISGVAMFFGGLWGGSIAWMVTGGAMAFASVLTFLVIAVAGAALFAIALPH